MKRGQVTLFIILGMVLLAGLMLFLWLRNNAAVDQLQNQQLTTQQIPKEAVPVTQYVQTALDDAAERGLLLIGMQGGHIYREQGGLTDEGIKSAQVDSYAVPYGLLRQTAESSWFYYPNPWEYPWKGFPCMTYTCPCTEQDAEFDIGQFGTNNLPDLEGTGPSIESQLRLYIMSDLQQNLKLEIFNEQGFRIVDGEMDVRVVIAENDVVAELDYPLQITKPAAGFSANVSRFSSRQLVRLRQLYTLADKLVEKDIVDARFDIDSQDNDGDSMIVAKIADVTGSHDDLIRITDSESKLYTEPYVFQFSRENRNPALHYICFPQGIVKGTIRDMIIEEDIDATAYDPDEDETTITYTPALPIPVASLAENPVFTITVEVTDGILKDWQEVTTTVIGFTNEEMP